MPCKRCRKAQPRHKTTRPLLKPIPQLIRHFTRKYAERMNKRIEIIPCEAMEILMKYSWPGNIRELQNFIQRAVILSCGPALSLRAGTGKPVALNSAEPGTLTLKRAVAGPLMAGGWLTVRVNVLVADPATLVALTVTT